MLKTVKKNTAHITSRFIPYLRIDLPVEHLLEDVALDLGDAEARVAPRPEVDELRREGDLHIHGVGDGVGLGQLHGDPRRRLPAAPEGVALLGLRPGGGGGREATET